MSKITIEKQLADKYIIEVEDTSILDCIKKISIFAEVEKCTCCGSKNIYISYHKATPKSGPRAGESFDYYDWACRDCKAKANIGQYKGNTGIFLKSFEKYDGGNKIEEDNPNTWPTHSEPVRTSQPVSTTTYANSPAKF